MTQTLSREIPLVPSQSALLFIDVQNFAARREGAVFRDIPDAEFQANYGWYFRELSTRVVSNMQRLQAAFRKAKERHDNSLRAIRGYCRQRHTDQVIAE